MFKRHLTLLGLPLLAGSTFSQAQSIELVPAEGLLKLPGDSSLSINAHLRAVTGRTSAEEPGELVSHAHDPLQESLTLQGLEVSTSFRSQYFEAFATGSLFSDADNDFDTEDEEIFGKFVNLPGGFEVRAGQYLNRVGLQNNVHLHGWNFVDSNLSTGQFLGEEGLVTEGAEVSWLKRADSTAFGFSLSSGKAREHGHEEEEEEEGEEHGHSESVENAFFTGDLFTARAFFDFTPNDFNTHRIGLNWAEGENAFGRDTQLGSIDYTYTWRENGLERGGREFSIGAEAFFRSVEWVHEEDESVTGTTDQNAFMLLAGYSFSDNWRVDARYGIIEGVSDGALEVSPGDFENGFEIGERERISLALTHRLFLNDTTSGMVRLQYNHDDLDELGGEDSIWLQFGFDFGGPEVR